MRNQSRQRLFLILIASGILCFIVLSFMWTDIENKFNTFAKITGIKFKNKELYGITGIGKKFNTFFAKITDIGSSNKDQYDTVSVPISEIMTGQPIELPQDDWRIIKYIWDNNYIEPASVADYNLKNPDGNPSMGQSQFILNILKNMTDGFFVECGALDGEIRSNTLFMEKYLGWTGLLIEGDPSNYAMLRDKNRKAWSSNTCLAVKPYPHKAHFSQQFNLGKIISDEDVEYNEFNGKIATVQCMPLFSLLSALNITIVDYFSLDVEGNELQVLKSIPFEKVFIKTLSVEFFHTHEGQDNILQFMKSMNYEWVGNVTNAGGLANDFMFVHKQVLYYTL